MAQKNAGYLWPALALVAAIPRILAAFFLPNAFGDAYVYIRDIGIWSTKLSSGTFHLTDLFGFWLPLYQFISALLNVAVKNGFYSGKIVSALFGAGACLLVYLITLRLTSSPRAALVIFFVIALNPWHIFYSASAMTDVPHAFLVLGALHFVLVRKWLAAAAFGALAGFTRVESWMLIALIPFVQLIWERRISFAAPIVLAVPPLFWFYISWKATGNWLACFQQRQEYHDWLLIQNPAIARFSLANTLRDAGTLLVSTDVAVLIACIIAGSLLVKWSLGRNGNQNKVQSILAPTLFFFAFLGLLVVAYLVHQQPIIFPRYGLILFGIGLPVLAWMYRWVQKHKSRSARAVLMTVGCVLVLEAGIQLGWTIGTLRQISVQRDVAEYLRDHFDLNSGKQIFCDDGTVRVMSGIPDDKFVGSPDAPRDRNGFLSYLKQRRVEYLVFVDNQPATPNRIFHDLGDSDYGPLFEPLFVRHARFLPTEIRVYRFE